MSKRLKPTLFDFEQTAISSFQELWTNKKLEFPNNKMRIL